MDNEQPQLVPGRDFATVPWDPPEMFEQAQGAESDDGPRSEPEADPVERAQVLLEAGVNDNDRADADDVGDEVDAVEVEPEFEAPTLRRSNDGDFHEVSAADLRKIKVVREDGRRLDLIPQDEYTRKTQELAVERKEARRAIDDYGVVLKHIEKNYPGIADAAREEHQRLTQSQREGLQRRQGEVGLEFVQSRFNGDYDAAHKATLAAMRNAAERYNVSAQELANIDRAGLLEMLHDAYGYRQLLKEQGEVRSKVVKPESRRVVRPRARSRRPTGEKTRSAEYEVARDRHRRTGDTNDAVRAILAGGWLD